MKYAQQGEKLRREEAARRRAAAAEQAEADLINFQESMEREVAFAEERKQILEDLGLGPESEMEKLRLRHEEEQQLLESRLGWTAEYADLELALLARQKGEVVALEQKSAAKQRATRAKLYNDLLGFAARVWQKGAEDYAGDHRRPKGRGIHSVVPVHSDGRVECPRHTAVPRQYCGGGGGDSQGRGIHWRDQIRWRRRRRRREYRRRRVIVLIALRTGLARPVTAAAEEPQRREIDITLKSYPGAGHVLDKEGIRSLDARQVIEESGGGRDFINARVHHLMAINRDFI